MRTRSLQVTLGQAHTLASVHAGVEDERLPQIGDGGRRVGDEVVELPAHPSDDGPAHMGDGRPNPAT